MLNAVHERSRTRLIFGEKICARPVHHVNDEANVWGSWWHAEHRPTSYVLSYLHGGHGGGEAEMMIEAAEFDLLRTNPECVEAIIIKHGG